MRVIFVDDAYNNTMKSLRSSLFIGLISLSLLILIGGSFVPCLQIHADDCCGEEGNCSAPVCDGGASCHCACAFTGTPLWEACLLMAPSLSPEVPVETALRFSFILPDFLYRPPRLS